MFNNHIIAHLENMLHFKNLCPCKFMGFISPLQMQKDFFQNDLWTKSYNKLKPRIIYIHRYKV